MDAPSRPRPLVLCILDGWGERADKVDNAVAARFERLQQASDAGVEFVRGRLAGHRDAGDGGIGSVGKRSEHFQMMGFGVLDELSCSIRWLWRWSCGPRGP